MASNFESSIHRGSDLFYDFSCFTCRGNDINREAEFYCEECSKFYCGECVKHHDYINTKHATMGKRNISKWPVSNAAMDVLEQCLEHRKEKLTGFCEDHSELLCHVCHIYSHQKCSHVVHIADKVKALHQKGDFQQLSTTIDTLHGQFIQKKDDFEERLHTLENSYKKILEEINALRNKINDSLDQLQRNTIKELDTLLAGMRTSIQTDIENCSGSIKKIKCVQDDWQKIKDKSETQSFIMYRKCLDQSIKTEEVLQEITSKNEVTLTFNPDTTIEQTLSTLSGLGQILSNLKQSSTANSVTPNLVTTQTKSISCISVSGKTDPGNQTSDVNKSGLVSNPESHSDRQPDHGNQASAVKKPGLVSNPVSISYRQPDLGNQTCAGNMPDLVSDPNQVITVKSSTKHTVRMKSDSATCWISGICGTGTGELLITDWYNNKVKLLDQTYNPVAHYALPGGPQSMCSIDSSLVAVAIYNREIYFIRVTNGQLVKDRTLKLQHKCTSVAHHQGNLYITSGTALYHYTVDGRLVDKMYEDTSCNRTDTVESCAVSPDGDRIYVANIASNKLVTLSRDGTLITLTDPALQWSNVSVIGMVQLLCVPPGLHVTDSGQVLVCGGSSNTILQVDRDGRQRLAQVVIMKDVVTDLISVYYSKHTGSLIVGMYNEHIMVFKTK